MYPVNSRRDVHVIPWIEPSSVEIQYFKSLLITARAEIRLHTSLERPD